MVAMSANVDLTASLEGGAGAACLRSCCAGESAFFSHFFLREGSSGTCGDVLLAPAVPGEIIMLRLKGEEWRIQKGSFMAADETVSVGARLREGLRRLCVHATETALRAGTAVQGFAKGCCSGEGFFILKASGVGRLILNSYGSIIRYGAL